jgi:xanthine/CO dehydrogenase XdhC/CoxF family maturation factor
MAAVSAIQTLGKKELKYRSLQSHFGGGDLEHRVLDEAWIAISDGTARTLKYTLSDPARGDPGVCGGTVEVFVERILPPAMIVVIGGGHVGKAVVHLAKWLGSRVVVSDDRPDFCNPESVPGAGARCIEQPSNFSLDGPQQNMDYLCDQYSANGRGE